MTDSIELINLAIQKDLDPGLIKSSGRGDYVPVADNSTPEGRAINRRVEVKIYNSYNSPAQGE